MASFGLIFQAAFIRDRECTTTTVGEGCGGQVETVLVSARSKMAYQSTAGDPANFNNTYDGANILRTMAEALGLNTSGWAEPPRGSP